MPEVDVHQALDDVANGAPARTLESEVLDFKTVGRSVGDALTDLAEAAACFANGRGGTIVVGVKDRPGGPEAFAGTSLDVTSTRRAIFERTDPHLTVDVETAVHSEKNLLIVRVPEGATVHAVQSKHTERIGTSCMPMHSGRIARVMADRSGDDWSDGDSELGIDAVDPFALATARKFLEGAVDPTRQSWARLRDAELLRVIGAVTTRGTLNRAGALLLTTADGLRENVTYSHRQTPTGSLTASESFTTPALNTLDRVFDLISARVNTTSVDIGRGRQLQVEDLPATAVREAVVNALMHRDHRTGGRIVIEHAATRIAVTSPGSFLTGIDGSNVLTAASRTRNPRLAEAIRKLGLAETAGTGVDRMYASMTRLGHQPPAFDADDATVRVTLVGGSPNEYLTRFVAALPSEEAEDADAMLILLTLLGTRTINATELAGPLQKSVIEVQSVLDRLAAPPREIVEPTRESIRRTHPSYRLREGPLAALGPAVSYRRRTTDSSDRKVLALLRESGQINSRMVKLVLDTDTSQTSRILADLVDRGLLVKNSKAARGPGVTYAPGPRTPGRSRARRASSTSDPSQAELRLDEDTEPDT